MGTVLIFDDGHAKLYRYRLDRRVLVQVEGKLPTAEQIEACRRLWTELYAAMGVRVASFCQALPPYSREIMAPTIENIPA